MHPAASHSLLEPPGILEMKFINPSRLSSSSPFSSGHRRAFLAAPPSNPLAMDALVANLSDESDQGDLSDDSVFGDTAHAFAADQGSGDDVDLNAAYLPAGAFSLYPLAGAFGTYPPAGPIAAAFAAGPFAAAAAGPFAAAAASPNAAAFAAGPFAAAAAASPNAAAFAAFAAGPFAAAAAASPNAASFAAFAAGPFTAAAVGPIAATAIPVGPIAAADNDPAHDDDDTKNPWKPVVRKRFRRVRGRSMPLPDPPASPEKLLNEIPWVAKTGNNRRDIKKHAQEARSGYASTSDGPGYLVFGSFGATSLEL